MIVQKMLMHKTSRDTAIEIIRSEGFLWWKRYLVNVYNVNLTMIANEKPMFLCQIWIKLDKMKNYYNVEIGYEEIEL